MKLEKAAILISWNKIKNYFYLKCLKNHNTSETLIYFEKIVHFWTKDLHTARPLVAHAIPVTAMSNASTALGYKNTGISACFAVQILQLERLLTALQPHSTANRNQAFLKEKTAESRQIEYSRAM